MAPGLSARSALHACLGAIPASSFLNQDCSNPADSRPSGPLPAIRHRATHRSARTNFRSGHSASQAPRLERVRARVACTNTSASASRALKHSRPAWFLRSRRAHVDQRHFRPQRRVSPMTADRFPQHIPPDPGNEIVIVATGPAALSVRSTSTLMPFNGRNASKSGAKPAGVAASSIASNRVLPEPGRALRMLCRKSSWLRIIAGTSRMATIRCFPAPQPHHVRNHCGKAARSGAVPAMQALASDVWGALGMSRNPAISAQVNPRANAVPCRRKSEPAAQSENPNHSDARPPEVHATYSGCAVS